MDESVVTRVMPNSIEAEQSVVGSMILDRQAIITAAEILRQDDFYYRQYGTMFQTMVDMNNEGKPVDIVTLQARLKETDVPAEVYSIEFVRELLSSVPTSANIRQYAGIVKEKAVLRNIISVMRARKRLKIYLLILKRRYLSLLRIRAARNIHLLIRLFLRHSTEYLRQQRLKVL